MLLLSDAGDRTYFVGEKDAATCANVGRYSSILAVGAMQISLYNTKPTGIEYCAT